MMLHASPRTRNSISIEMGLTRARSPPAGSLPALLIQTLPHPST
jgi:hypothetical protein